ncbi:anti-sigma factor domain-containing protein [Albirhodobacter sp. R86504]|uniref:anti-sigma factor n=1 Tax=Albirhodobacter sp. R86504 TaxID=3093848 RepID=UPI00366FE768
MTRLTSQDRAEVAEYVLGVMPKDERPAMTARIMRDADFAREAKYWEATLDPLSDEVAPLAPPNRVWRGVERRLFKPAAMSVWRWFGPALGGALAVLAVVGFLRSPDAGPVWVADMATPEGLRLAALYDEDKGEMRVSMAGISLPNDRDVELWLIAGERAPISLGVMPRTGQAAMPIPADLRDLVAGATMAISDEPLGGSPTGQATGPVLAVAPMVRI